MQSEEFDKRIKDAAEHHHPSYNEQAWDKMGKLLDKHLPQEKDDRRKYILIIFLFLFTGGGLYLLLAKPWRDAEHISAASEEVKTTIPDKTSGVATNDKKNHENISDEKEIPTPDISNIKQNNSPVIDINQEEQKQKTKKSSNYPVFSQTELGRDDFKNKNLVNRNRKPLQKDDIIATGNETNKKDDNKEIKVPDNKLATGKIAGDTPDEIIADKDKKADNITKAGSEDKPEIASTTPNKKDKATVHKKRNIFFLSLSAGLDISSIQFRDNGKLMPVIGIGAGYTVADKFTLRTGFYTARKIYSAERNEYKPATLPVNWNYLYEIDANCKVYEVPLLFSYNFGRSKKHNWFGSAGLSSYFMKEEKYDYKYKYPGGQTYSYMHAFKNENKHYFSVLSLSAGYTRKINDKFSLVVEPYVKLPLTGIGYGNIKLNSAGVLFTATFNPFRSAKK